MSLRVHITSENFADLPKMGLDDSGEITLKFKVKGANIYDDETMSENTVSYDLDCEITDMTVNKKGLTESLESAMEKQIPMVRTAVTPFPGA